MSRHDRAYVAIILASAAIFFLPNLGRVHLFDWDEINFAESAREMIVTGDYGRVQIDFRPFWEKPPLFFWLQCGSMKLFGINEFAARLPNALCGIVTLLTFFFIGRRTVDAQFGFLWAIAYLGSLLPHLYFKSGIIDPVFNYFIFMGVYCAYQGIRAECPHRSARDALLSGLFIGLANLTKGPVGLLLFLLTMAGYGLWLRFQQTPRRLVIPRLKPVLAFLLAFTIVSCAWFGLEAARNGFWFLEEFVKYQIGLLSTPVAGHRQPWFYHLLVVFLGCFPMSVFALPVLFRSRPHELSDQAALMRILFWVVMIVFTIVTTKIVHYSSMCYLPLSFLAAVYLHGAVNQKIKVRPLVLGLLLLVGLLICAAFIAVPLAGQHTGALIPYVKNPFTIACLQTPVVWQGYEVFIGVVYAVCLGMSLWMIGRDKGQQGVIMLFYSTAACASWFMLAVVPKIDAYYQAPAVNFYKSLAGQDVHVTAAGFKSYSHLFYFQKPGRSEYGDREQETLLHGKINKPAYFVTKISNIEFPANNPECQRIKQEGGYVFYVRMPKD